jgi:hypothetical protein
MGAGLWLHKCSLRDFTTLRRIGKPKGHVVFVGSILRGGGLIRLSWTQSNPYSIVTLTQSAQFMEKVIR